MSANLRIVPSLLTSLMSDEEYLSRRNNQSAVAAPNGTSAGQKMVANLTQRLRGLQLVALVRGSELLRCEAVTLYMVAMALPEELRPSCISTSCETVDIRKPYDIAEAAVGRVIAAVQSCRATSIVNELKLIANSAMNLLERQTHEAERFVAKVCELDRKIRFAGLDEHYQNPNRQEHAGRVMNNLACITFLVDEVQAPEPAPTVAGADGQSSSLTASESFTPPSRSLTPPSRSFTPASESLTPVFEYADKLLENLTQIQDDIPTKPKKDDNHDTIIEQSTWADSFPIDFPGFSGVVCGSASNPAMKSDSVDAAPWDSTFPTEFDQQPNLAEAAWDSNFPTEFDEQPKSANVAWESNFPTEFDQTVPDNSGEVDSDEHAGPTLIRCANDFSFDTMDEFSIEGTGTQYFCAWKPMLAGLPGFEEICASPLPISPVGSSVATFTNANRRDDLVVAPMALETITVEPILTKPVTIGSLTVEPTTSTRPKIESWTLDPDAQQQRNQAVCAAYSLTFPPKSCAVYNEQGKCALCRSSYRRQFVGDKIPRSSSAEDEVPNSPQHTKRTRHLTIMPESTQTTWQPGMPAPRAQVALPEPESIPTGADRLDDVYADELMSEVCERLYSSANHTDVDRDIEYTSPGCLLGIWVTDNADEPGHQLVTFDFYVQGYDSVQVEVMDYSEDDREDVIERMMQIYHDLCHGSQQTIDEYSSVDAGVEADEEDEVDAEEDLPGMFNLDLLDMDDDEEDCWFDFDTLMDMLTAPVGVWDVNIAGPWMYDSILA